ncbi:MAG: four-carbon acid sugar kinase family protein, partial [Bacillota bacterium]
MTDKIGIIADDFTGASDIGSFLNLAGAKTVLVNGIPENSNYDYSAYDAVVIALKSRSISPQKAVNYTKKAYKFLVK